jgi:integral membrane sensor domain MASE1
MQWAARLDDLSGVPARAAAWGPLAAAPRLPYLAQVLLLALAYGAVGKLCLVLSSRFDIVALVYAPEGIALAAGLWFGVRVWPGVFLGELGWTLTTGQPFGVSLALAAGNAADQALGVYLLRGRLRFAPALERPRDVVALTAVVLGVCAPISATVGVTALRLAGAVAPDQYAATWFSWWLANVIGQVLVAPLLLTWAAHPTLAWRRARLVPTLATSAALALVIPLAFGYWRAVGLYHHAAVFAIFPLLIWIGIRFGPREAASAALVVVVAALAATESGFGPFATGPLEDHVVYLNLFMLGASLTALGVAAVFAERRQLEEARVARARLEGVLLAARTIEHELCNQLALTVGWAELLKADPALPPALREAADGAHTGALAAATTVQQLQQLNWLPETDWGPDLPTTIDLARPRPPAP